MTGPIRALHTRHRPDGPPAGIVAAVILGLASASVVAAAVSSMFWSGFFAFAASVPIGIYAATVYARLLKLGIRVPGPGISLVGGISASLFLAFSGFLTWAPTQVSPVSHSVATLVTEVADLLGGVGFATGLGLLIAGIAVPSMILRLTPRWFAGIGLVLAALGELSFLSMLWPGLVIVLPIVRFGGLAWLVVTGFSLPHDRREVPRRARSRTR